MVYSIMYQNKQRQFIANYSFPYNHEKSLWSSVCFAKDVCLWLISLMSFVSILNDHFPG